MAKQKTRPIAAYELIPFKPVHLEGALALSQAAGWAHRHEDWAMLLPLTRGLVAIHAGRVAGTALRADFGHLSTICMVMVDEALRSQGLGRKITTQVIGDVPRALRLVATKSGTALYEKLGFETVERIATVQGITQGTALPPGIRNAIAADLPQITQLESNSFGGDRGALVDWLWHNAQLAVSGRGADISGFAVRRRFGNGHVIGPVVAPCAEEALDLIAYLLDGVQGQFVRLDITGGSGLLPGLEKMGFKLAHTAPLMQRDTITATPARRALFGQALI